MIRVESALRQLFRGHLLSHIWRCLIGRHHFLPVRYISRHVRSGITRQLRRQLELVGRRHLLLLTCVEWMRAVAHLGSGRRGIRLRRRHFGRDFVRMRLFRYWFEPPNEGSFADRGEVQCITHAV